MLDLIKELENNKNDTIRIDYIIERLKDICFAEEYFKGEIYFNIENMVNDDFLDEEKKEKLAKLNDEDIQVIVDNLMYDDYRNSNFNEDIQYQLNKLIESRD